MRSNVVADCRPGIFAALVLLVSAALASPAEPPAPTAPAPYSLPWLLRSAVPTTALRLDETAALYEDPGSGASGSTWVTGLAASYRLGPRWAPVVRVLWVDNHVPDGSTAPSGHAFSNPVLGVGYFHPLGGGWRWTGFLASSVPIGSGGGTGPDPGASAAMTAGVAARSGMDNTLFAVNYWGMVGGLDLARVTKGLTVQAEVTLFQLTRVRGPQTQDQSRTNLTAAVHLGHFFTPRLSLGAELRMQRWMSDAAPVRAYKYAREQFTFAVGPRLHLKAGRRVLRPGLSYTRALDEPMSSRGYDIVQLDLPVVF